MTKVIVKIVAWMVFVVSGTYLAIHFGRLTALAIVANFSGFYMIQWINDKENGRLR